MSALVWPAAVALVALDAPAWIALVWLPLVFAFGAGRFTLMLHAICHRPLFRRGHPWLGRWIDWGLGPFFGHTPGSFYAHHMGMHHPENNLGADLSSTLGYRRDRFDHFLHYWARFFLLGAPNLSRYLAFRRRKRLVRRLWTGELAWLAVAAGLFAVRPGAAVALVIGPLVGMRFFMMAGNWAQHAFIDVNDPGCCYRNSTCLTDARYNRNCFNDGYHIVHHLKPALHWTELPDWFAARAERFGEQDAVVFQGLDNNQIVWWCLMTQQWERLARHVVALPGAPVRDLDARVAWLQDRVRRRRSGLPALISVEPADARGAAAL